MLEDRPRIGAGARQAESAFLTQADSVTAPRAAQHVAAVRLLDAVVVTRQGGPAEAASNLDPQVVVVRPAGEAGSIGVGKLRLPWLGVALAPPIMFERELAEGRLVQPFDTSGFLAGAASAPAAQLAPNSFAGPDAQERNSKLAASMRVLKAHGYI